MPNYLSAAIIRLKFGGATTRKAANVHGTRSTRDVVSCVLTCKLRGARGTDEWLLSVQIKGRETEHKYRETAQESRQIGWLLSVWPPKVADISVYVRRG